MIAKNNNSSNLGTIFAPSLFRSSITDNLVMPMAGISPETIKNQIKEQLSKELNPSITLLQFFIDNHELIFKDLNLESRIVMLKSNSGNNHSKSKTTPDTFAPIQSAANAKSGKKKNNRAQTISFLDNESINFEETLKRNNG